MFMNDGLGAWRWCPGVANNAVLRVGWWFSSARFVALGINIGTA
jgi:hypothetical protein